MDKILKFYKIPDAKDITNVYSVNGTLPTDPVEGDKYITMSPLRIYEAITVSSGGVSSISWMPISFVDGMYYRVTSENEPVFYQYSSGSLTYYDAKFPSTGLQAETYDFTYSASRMGNAPSLTTTLMHRTCLDELWTDRVCTFFNGSFFFLRNKPSSKKSNEDERYEHSLEMLSERTLLENVYLANIADASLIQTDPVALQYSFSIFGGIAEVVTLINETMKYEKLHKNGIGFSLQIAQDTFTQDFISDLEEPEQMYEVSENTIKEALDKIYDTWGVPYYFVGYDIYIGFSNEPQIAEEGFTMPTLEYGITNELLSIQKSQKNDVKNRITGFGSEENLPYFYPNNTPGGLMPVYLRSGSVIDDAVKVINPYRVVNVEASETTSPQPDGTYYIYGPVDMTHTFDQMESTNRTTTIVINGFDIVRQPRLSDETRTRVYFTVNTTTQQRNLIKEVWVWLKDGTTTSLEFKEKVLEEDFEPSAGETPFDSLAGSVRCWMVNATREQWEQLSLGTNTSGYPALTNSVSLTYYASTNSVTWSDSTTTNSFWDKFPITISSVPQTATCALMKIVAPVSASQFNDILQSWAPKMKRIYNSVIKQEYIGGPDWTNGDSGVLETLYFRGLRVQNVTPQLGDIIYYEQNEVEEFCSRLLPYNFRAYNDVWLNALDNTYLRQNSQSVYYDFENQYKYSCAKEIIEDHDEIKPTIKGMKNSDTPSKYIDRFVDIAFDAEDNNELDASGENYLHSYFYVKLARTNKAGGYGFNLFDCAVSGSVMQLSMTSGDCGGCTFDVMVKYLENGLAKNPVAVFETATTINGITYPAGTPKRDSKGNVDLTAAYQDEQQDTENNEVWIALKKDNSTFQGMTLPDTSNNIVPVASTDTFVILNINLPVAYVVDAEQRLYYALLDSLEKQNARQYNFSIQFSSIYYKSNYEFLDQWLNEASKVPFVYNNETLNYYVSSYTYRMSHDRSLPEITIELEEEVKPKRRFVFPTIERQDRTAVITSQSQKKDISVDNLHVDGDITLNDGTSVNAQIGYINDIVFELGEKISSTRSIWDVVSRRAEAKNLFVDGAFAYGLSTRTDTSAVSSVNNYGLFGDKSLFCEIEDAGYVTFTQHIDAQGGIPYSLVFFSKTVSSNDETIRAELRFHESVNDTFTTYYQDFDNTQDWKQNIMTFTAPDNTDYVEIRMSNPMNASIGIDVDGLMLFADDFSDVDYDGSFVPNELCPIEYMASNEELSKAIENASGSQTAGTLDTTSATGLTTSSSESLSGNISLHKVSKTGSYNDLLNKPQIPSSVSDLQDMVISSPSDDDILRYDSTTSKWVNEAIGKTISTLGTSVRIWDTETGVYILPTSCTVYYYGASSTLYQEILYGGILHVWQRSNSLKQFVIFNHNYYGDGNVNATYRYIAGYSTASYGGLRAIVIPELPSVSSTDNGKVLTVVNGAWAAQNAAVPETYIETTYSSLAALVTNSTLESGAWYRITDYVTKTEFSAAISDEHAFDLLVFATSSNTLDCHAFAALNANDTYFTNAGSDLSKWQIWYDIENDNGKYDWADSTSGKGVIYRMIDEFGNDCPYDFKNMRFTGIDGLTSGKYYYTFNLTTDSETTMSDFSLDGQHCYSNTIGYYLSGLCYYINPNVFKNTNASSFCMMNKIGMNCNGNVFGTQCYRNEIGDYSVYNKFGSFCHHISFGEGSGYCSIGQYCDTISFGNLCHQVYIGSSSSNLVNYCRNITIANNTRYFRLYDTGTASSSNYLQNIDVKAGMSGTMNTPVSVSTITRNNGYVTVVGKDSNGNTIIYCEEDADSSLPAVSSSDNGKVLGVSNGVWAAVLPVTIYSGTSAPSSSTGSDGDIYIQTAS